MKRAIQFVVFSSAVVLAVAGNCAGQLRSTLGDPVEGKTNDKQVRGTLVGPWRAESASMQTSDGGRKTLAGADQPVSLIFSERTCTLRSGTNVLAEMTYVLDSKRNPWTIDMKSKQGALVGICALKGDKLQISLDEPAAGRPGDFDQQKHGMVLALRRSRRMSLVVMNADGSNLHLVPTMPEYTFVGSPKWSHDGRKIAFSGWRSVMGENNRDSRMFVINAGGGSRQDLGAGPYLSWSPDDKQFVYCQYDNGVWIMNADGSDRRQIEGGNWGSQWSPKGNEIAYGIYDNRGAILAIYDAAKNQRRELTHKRYNQIYWGMTWSPDGRWICFKGDPPGGGCEIAAVSAEGEEKGFKVLLPSSALPEVRNADSTMSWGGTGSQILVCMQRKTDRVRHIYILDSTGAAPPRLFPKFPLEWAAMDPNWSSDGKKVVVSAVPTEPQPQDSVAAPARGAAAAPASTLTLVPASQPSDAKEDAEASTLDLSQYCLKENSQWPVLESFSGRQVVDGLPFQIDGQVRAYGKTPEAHADGVYPFTHKGIRIGRKFDYLYLIHHATWPDVDGATIAYVVLNYADAAEYIIPICYGVHVRDWFNLPSYEKEAVTDPDTTICWRRDPVKYKAPVRIFESRFENPSPETVVVSMDIVSARNQAAYNLLAATVSNHRAALAAAEFPGNRKFDGKVAIRVEDAVTGRPIAGALVLPGMTVLDEGVVSSPFHSSAAGKGTIPYPTKVTSDIFASVEKKGYRSESTSWVSPFPDTFTFRLKPIEAQSP